MARTSQALNDEIGALLQSYFSAYTGDEVDAAIKAASTFMAFMRENVIVPVATLTGDYLVQKITTLTQDMWLDSITLVCQKPFSVSASGIRYSVETSSGDELVVIPTAFMTDEGQILTYPICKQIRTDTTINMVCSSTRAFGEVLVKLNFQ